MVYRGGERPTTSFSVPVRCFYSQKYDAHQYIWLRHVLHETSLNNTSHTGIGAGTRYMTVLCNGEYI